MRAFPTTRPSPALIVAMIALVLALAGTSLAGGTAAKISKKNVKAIAAKQIDKLAPGLDVNSAKTATTADSATTAATADSAKIASNVLSANVHEDGSMLRSIPGGATSTRTAEGDYTVSFGRDLTDCTISASAASNPTDGPSIAFVSVAFADAGPDAGLRVFTRSPTNVVHDEPFYVQAICPG